MLDFFYINQNKANQMQQTVVYSSIVSQNISGVFMPIVRRVNCALLHMVYSTGYCWL
jgi:hypothetical protein